MLQPCFSEILLHVINCLIRLLVVEEIQAARWERKTFEERRKWVTQSKELDRTIEQVMTSQILSSIQDVDQVCIHDVPIQNIPSKRQDCQKKTLFQKTLACGKKSVTLETYFCEGKQLSSRKSTQDNQNRESI